MQREIKKVVSWENFHGRLSLVVDAEKYMIFYTIAPSRALEDSQIFKTWFPAVNWLPAVKDVSEKIIDSTPRFMIQGKICLPLLKTAGNQTSIQIQLHEFETNLKKC